MSITDKADKYMKDVIENALKQIQSELAKKGIEGKIVSTDKYSVMLSFNFQDVPQHFSVSLEPVYDHFEVRVKYSDYREADPGNTATMKSGHITDESGNADMDSVTGKDIVKEFYEIYEEQF